MVHILYPQARLTLVVPHVLEQERLAVVHPWSAREGGTETGRRPVIAVGRQRPDLVQRLRAVVLRPHSKVSAGKRADGPMSGRSCVPRVPVHGSGQAVLHDVERAELDGYLATNPVEEELRGTWIVDRNLGQLVGPAGVPTELEDPLPAKLTAVRRGELLEDLVDVVRRHRVQVLLEPGTVTLYVQQRLFFEGGHEYVHAGQTVLDLVVRFVLLLGLHRAVLELQKIGGVMALMAHALERSPLDHTGARFYQSPRKSGCSWSSPLKISYWELLLPSSSIRYSAAGAVGRCTDECDESDEEGRDLREEVASATFLFLGASSS